MPLKSNLNNSYGILGLRSKHGLSGVHARLGVSSYKLVAPKCEPLTLIVFSDIGLYTSAVHLANLLTHSLAG